MEELKIIPVITRKERKEFVEYPLRLYKGNPYFVPPFYADEMNLFTSKNIYNKLKNKCYIHSIYSIYYILYIIILLLIKL